MNYKEKKYLFLTLLSAFVYILTLAFQGFDLCDEGFVLTSYQQIFNSPSSVEYNFSLYLTMFTGGIWNFFFGFGGILSFRVFTVITIVFTIYFTYLAAKSFMAPKIIPLAAFFVLLLNYEGIISFHHNYFTALLVACGVLLILSGLNEASRLKLFFGFFVIGVNVFSRLPNITMAALGGLIIIDYLYNKDIKILGKNIFSGLSGFLAGIATVILLMLIFGHWEYFKEAINNILQAGQDSEGNHSIKKLLKVYYKNYVNVYTYLAIFSFTCVIFGCLYNFSQKKAVKIFSIAGFSVLTILFVLTNFNAEKYYSVILLPLILSYFVDYRKKSVILLNSASLIIMFFLSLGSDFGIGNMGYSCIWLATFVSAGHVYRFIRYQIITKRHYGCLVLSWCLFILYAINGLYMISQNAYFDKGSRFEKIYRANTGKFTVYTTKAKADAINELLAELNRYVGKNDYLFAFESLPTIHYLTETKPFTGNSWTWTYTPELFKFKLEKSVAQKPLPAVLRQKCQPLGGYWTVPAGDAPDKDSFAYKRNRVKYFEGFLDRYNYQLAWENELFAIYVP